MTLSALAKIMDALALSPARIKVESCLLKVPFISN